MKSYAVYNNGDVPNLVRLLLILIVSIVAAMTVVTHVAQITGVPFSTYAVIGICVSATVAALVLWGEGSKHLFLAVTMQRGTVLVVLACALMGSVLSLVCHRPNLDDVYYITNAVYYVEHADEPMGFKVPLLGFRRARICFFGRCANTFLWRTVFWR